VGEDNLFFSTISTLDRHKIALCLWNHNIPFRSQNRIHRILLGQYFQFPYSHPFRHCLPLASFTSVTNCDLLRSLGSPFEFWELLSPVPSLILSVSACTLCIGSFLSLLVNSHSLHRVFLASRTESVLFFLHFHYTQCLLRVI
jgi:hypothetical protein